MSLPPIVPLRLSRLSRLSEADKLITQRVAEDLRRQFPQLMVPALFADLVTEHIDARPSLHCDDLTEIMRTPSSGDISFFQERARFRAMNGDYVAAAFPIDESFEQYCSTRLGLGRVNWLAPECGDDPTRLAEACWKDRAVRRELIHAVRRHGLRYIHPHYGTQAIWELALMLKEASHLPISVIGAHPGLARFVNDKGQFAAVVEQLFGPCALPPTEVVWNGALAAEQLRLLGRDCSRVSVKLPSSAGGFGNLVFTTASLQSKSLSEIRQLLKRALPAIGYQSGDELVVSVWEDEVLASQSAQLWIPPRAEGGPVLEGFFEQFVSAETGEFTGCAPTNLIEELAANVERRCLMLGAIFQDLGYVGRCSFDLLMVGQSLETATSQFIECNGRWGGASLPMTLVNRLLGSSPPHCFAVSTCKIEGLGGLPFSDLLRGLGTRAFDIKTRRGEFVLACRRLTQQRDHITTIALAGDQDTAKQLVLEEFPALAKRLMNSSAEERANP